jgi:hypothetical protein
MSHSQFRSQEFVRATVHLAGDVGVETGHVARFTVEHVQARIGSALLYLLDYTAAADFARAALAAAALAAAQSGGGQSGVGQLAPGQRGGGLFAAAGVGGLPAEVWHGGQDSSVIVRMRGTQPVAFPQAVAASGSRHGRAYLSCQVGGLVLVLHDTEAVQRLVLVADTVHRVAAALWPGSRPAGGRAGTRWWPGPARRGVGKRPGRSVSPRARGRG